MQQYRYLHLDVFTDRPFEGNQLAVLPDARGLAAATMQAIAKEMAFAETTFILPAEGTGDIRMRIFTPERELAMAGHPTIGSTFALAHLGTIAHGRPRFVFELGVGPTAVDLEWDPGSLSFAWMSQRPPEFGPPMADVTGLGEALGLAAGDFAADPAPQQVSCGVPFLFVRLATRRAVDAAEADRRGLARFYERHALPELPVFIFATPSGPESDGATCYSRMFAPGFGITEDPATGGASGPLGCYLVRHGVVTPDEGTRLVSLQGVKMGRPSRIHIDIGSNGGAIDRVRVGGRSVLVAEGQLRVGHV
jgi:trans-2,3-dihydro-3-hydroxyanthranilate isomerase